MFAHRITKFIPCYCLLALFLCLSPIQLSAQKTQPNVVIPKVKDKGWLKNNLDAFVLAQIEVNKLKPSPQASRYVLARRAMLLLTGLPPSQKQLQQFLDDKSPSAYEDMIDRCLKTKNYRSYWEMLAKFHKKPARFENNKQAKDWVAVVWKRVFGVEFEEDTHPGLQAYLTGIAQNGDDSKLLRILVTSATFRQNYKLVPELKIADPDNRWLARFPASGLPKWVVRRNILFVGGLLKDADKLLSPKLLHPESEEPDDPKVILKITVSKGGKSENEWMDKATAAIALQILTKGGKTDEQRLRYAALLVLKRPLTKVELPRYQKAIASLRGRLAKDVKYARSVAKYVRELSKDVDDVDAALWSDVAWAMVNVNVFILKY